MWRIAIGLLLASAALPASAQMNLGLVFVAAPPLWVPNPDPARANVEPYIFNFQGKSMKMYFDGALACTGALDSDNGWMCKAGGIMNEEHKATITPGSHQVTIEYLDKQDQSHTLRATLFLDPQAISIADAGTQIEERYWCVSVAAQLTLMSRSDSRCHSD